MKRAFYANAIIAAGLLFFLGITGCQTNPQKQLLATNISQVELRSFQARVFDTNDKSKVMRSVISTLQDLGFVLENADLVLGTISGTKYGKEKYRYYELKMTVTVRPRGKSQMLVRANAQYNIEAVEDPRPYQNFFAALEKSLFLAAHETTGDEVIKTKQKSQVLSPEIKDADAIVEDHEVIDDDAVEDHEVINEQATKQDAEKEQEKEIKAEDPVIKFLKGIFKDIFEGGSTTEKDDSERLE